jgi:hypothetical protein
MFSYTKYTHFFVLFLFFTFTTFLGGCTEQKNATNTKTQEVIATIKEFVEEDVKEKETNIALPTYLEIKKGNAIIVREGKENVINSNSMDESKTFDLKKGDNIIVSDDGFAYIYWMDDSISRLKEGSKIIIQEMSQSKSDPTESKISFEVLESHVWSKVATILNPKGSFEATHKGVLAGVRGSAFDFGIKDGKPDIIATEHDIYIQKIDNETGEIMEETKKDETNIPTYMKESNWYINNKQEDKTHKEFIQKRQQKRVKKILAHNNTIKNSDKNKKQKLQNIESMMASINMSSAKKYDDESIDLNDRKEMSHLYNKANQMLKIKIAEEEFIILENKIATLLLNEKNTEEQIHLMRIFHRYINTLDISKEYKKYFAKKLSTLCRLSEKTELLKDPYNTKISLLFDFEKEVASHESQAEKMQMYIDTKKQKIPVYQMLDYAKENQIDKEDIKNMIKKMQNNKNHKGFLKEINDIETFQKYHKKENARMKDHLEKKQSPKKIFKKSKNKEMKEKIKKDKKEIKKEIKEKKTRQELMNDMQKK